MAENCNPNLFRCLDMGESLEFTKFKTSFNSIARQEVTNKKNSKENQ